MEGLTFTWDPKKAARNKAKHSVSFEEAQTVFYDESARLIADPDHSDDEDRYVLLGMSAQLRVLVVCHAYKHESTIRITSAWKADAQERKQYGDFRHA